MRRALPILSALLVATPAARAQSVTAPCTPRVEATPRVPPATLAALTAALSSDGPADRSCPVVRFDVANNRLVLTAVLDDGRQIARVLRHSRDALPTLVALLAVPALPIEGLAEPEAPATPVAPVTAPVVPSPAQPSAVSPAVPSRALSPALATGPLPSNGAALRVGVWGGFGASEHVSLVRLGVDLEHVRRDWTFGLRGDYNREGIRWTRGEGFMVAASARALDDLAVGVRRGPRSRRARVVVPAGRLGGASHGGRGLGGLRGDALALGVRARRPRD